MQGGVMFLELGTRKLTELTQELILGSGDINVLEPHAMVSSVDFTDDNRIL